MKFDGMWKVRPKEGYSFIYRYYDCQGKSFIGSTKRSLCERAGGETGKNYSRYESRFSLEILFEGFQSFEYEILEEVPYTLAHQKEKFYMRKFNSVDDGYNGNIHYKTRLDQYNESELDNLLNNIYVLMGWIIREGIRIDDVLKKFYLALGEHIFTITYSYYSGGAYYEKKYHPIALIFNFIEKMICCKYNNTIEIYEAMDSGNPWMEDPLLDGSYNKIDIVLLNGETVTFPLKSFN